MIKPERGYSLLLVLMTIVLVSVIGLSLFSISANSLKISAHERVDQSVFYIAEAGINYKDARLNYLIETAYNSAKLNPETFESNFDTQLQTILANEKANNINLSSSHFKTTFNGTPRAIISLHYSPTNPRSFKIISEGFLSQNKGSRKIEKLYELPADLMTVTEYELPTTELEEEDIPPVVPIVPSDEGFVKAPATFYVFDSVTMHLTPSYFINANIKVNFKKTLTRPFISNLIGRNRLLQKFTFNSPKVTAPLPASYSFPSYPTGKVSSKIALNSSPQKLESDKTVPAFGNLSSTTLDLDIENKTRGLYFSGNSTDYNLASVNINVKGTGILNIYFEKQYQLDATRSFKVSAKNATVNVFFKNGANIFGNMDIKGNAYTYDTYYSDLGNSKISGNLYAKNKITIGTTARLNVENIISEKKDVEVYGRLNTNNLYLKDGDLTVHTAGRLKSNIISVPNDKVAIWGVLNVNNLYTKDLVTHPLGRNNVNAQDEGEQEVPPQVVLPIEVPTTTIKDYIFTDNKNLFISHPIIEIE